jgi:hypothetical protein
MSTSPKLIELMQRGAVPNAPGWYVLEQDGTRHVCEVIRGPRGQLRSYVVGSEHSGPVTGEDTWIARIDIDQFNPLEF